MNRYVKHIKTLLLLTTLSSLIVWFYPMDTYKEFGSIAWFILIVVMFVRPLRDLFPKCKIFSFLLKFRRELWILVWVFGIAHTLWFAKMMDYSALGLFQDEYVWKASGMLFWGMLALLVSIPLLVTSNGISTKLLWKHWKTLQRLSYAMFVLVAIHIFMIHKDIGPFIPVVVWIVLFIVAYFKNKKSAQNSTSIGPKWLCVPCGYIYDENIGDPDSGIAPGTKFEDIPDDWRCPVCFVGKSDFILVEWDIILNDSTITQIKYLTQDVIELKVDVKKDFSYVSGQFITFAFSDTIGDFNRSYSIANKIGTVYMFLIKLKKDGRAGVAFKTMKEGDNLKFTTIAGKFQLLDTPNPKVFIATGTGLAPIYSMLLHTPENVSKKLYFWVAHLKDMFYQDTFQQFKNLEVKLYLSREEVEWYNFWRMNFENETFEPNTEFYICWNPGVVDGAKLALNAKWFTQVFSEEF